MSSINRNRAFLIKTTLMSVVFCFQFEQAQAVSKTENYNDLISKAQNLVLQKDRLQAMNILVAGIKKENPKSIAYSELKKNIEDLSQIFISEKAQQIYELALTLKKSDLATSTQKLQESLRIEPDQIQVLIELGRNQIAKGECNSAQEMINKNNLLFPYLESLKILQSQIFLCLNQLPELITLRGSIDSKKTNYPVQWMLIDVEKYEKQGQTKLAIDTINNARNLKYYHPEFYYWMWKLSKNVNEATKYLTECKKMSTGTYRQYLMEPQLCRRLGEVESELKNVPNTAE